jgi:DNA polymerase-3 subunit gamma/tau
VRVLVNALAEQRLHHAFLFTGTRGVGKTTIARIFAKALNCERGVSADPCGECSACREIDDGRFVDLIEVDAASRTKVEDTRDLLENVQYTPARGRYKVYLIDEVHMLSSHSFNALLKTHEEPPPHVKFLLATTDPQRLPVTVLSRCLQFHLLRMSASLIEDYLAGVMADEAIEFVRPALALIAQAADGSMRDALSLLDQAIAFCAGNVNRVDVAELLGTIDGEQVAHLLDALATADAPALLARVADIDRGAPDYDAMLAELISVLQRVAVVQTVPNAEVEDAENVRRWAAGLDPEDVQLFYQIALIGRRDLPLSPDPRGGFEMVLLRMLCFRPAGEKVAEPERSEDSRARGAEVAAVPPQQDLTPQPAATMEPAADTIPKAGLVPQELDWAALVPDLRLTGVALQFALNCVVRQHEGDAIHLQVDPAHVHLHTKGAQGRLLAALKAHFGDAIRLHVEVATPQADTPAVLEATRQAQRVEAATDQIHSDPNVQALRDTFGAQIRPESIEPTNPDVS